MTTEKLNVLRFNKMPLLFLVVVSLSISSCSTVRNAWTDFNAYFNTYYNAQNYFDRGVRQVEDQEVDYNPERPIRVHPTPAEVAQSDFEEAIERAVDIIYMHEDSRWVDNAVELIGKAYYYQHDFYSGAQNFDEIYNNAIDETRRQNAIMWRGKIYMEMEEYGAGISYLYNHLNSGEFDWDSQIEAETKLVLAQLYTYTEDWEEAKVYLQDGLQDISDRELRFRGWFLLGQVHEILGDYNNAIQAFEQAMDRRNEEFELLYYANLKKGEMMRNAGLHQEAYDHFHEMSRNDNFFEYLGDIEFHKANTLHQAGDIEEALDFYEVTLRQEVNPPSRRVNSRIYYNMAEIYRDHLLDYKMAAAYYDSSLTAMPDIEQMPKDFDVELMAESFGDYADLKTEVARMDSLLWLGTLDDEEFEAVIEEVREEKIREMEEEMRGQETATDVVVDEQDLEETDEIEDHGDSGFLNHLDRERSNRASQQFTAYWGNRPLVDDWRRGDAVRMAVQEGDTEEEVEEDEVIVDPEDADEEMAMQQVTVDIADVPFEEEDQVQMQKDLASASYEIGNVFFMSLDMPDSAAANYERIIENYPESDLVQQALYSLAEVYLSMDDTLMARDYAERLIDEHPGSMYAQRASERLDIPISDDALADTAVEDTTQKAWDELQEEFEDHYSQEYAEELRQFAYNYPDSEQAPLALYHASMAYINIAKEDTLFADLQKTKNSKQAEWEKEKANLESKRDSAKVILADTTDKTLSEDDEKYWKQWADTTFSEPDLSEYDPYKNAYWDSVRVVVANIQENYSDFTFNERLERIQDEIGKPDEPEPEEEEAEEPESEAREEELDYASCEELDREPEVLGGTDQFLRESEFQDTVNQMMLSGEFDITVIFDEEGNVIEVVYTEEDDPLGFMEELEEAILEYMQLSPPRIDEMEMKAKCTITMDLQYD